MTFNNVIFEASGAMKGGDRLLDELEGGPPGDRPPR
jgi:hypothetical protein